MNNTVCAPSKLSTAVFVPVLLCMLVFFAACDQLGSALDDALGNGTDDDYTATLYYSALFPSQVDDATLTVLGDDMVSATIDLAAESRSGQVSLPYGNYSYSLHLSWTENGWFFKKAATGVFTLSDANLREDVSFSYAPSDFAPMPYFTARDNPADFAIYAASEPETAEFIAFREVGTQEDLKRMLNAIKVWTTGYIKVDLSDCVIEAIEGADFKANAHIVALVLPETLRKIGTATSNTGVFNAWSALESVEFPTALYLTGDCTFSNCSELKTADLSACTLLKSIEARFFQNCAKLEKVTFPPSLKTIATYAFQGCATLAEIDLSGTHLESIGSNAFNQCASLASVELPATLRIIDASAFGNATIANACTKLEIPDFSRLPALTTIGNYAFAYCFPEAETEPDPNVEIEPIFETLDLSTTAVATIGTNAFQGCKRINKVILSASLTSIGTNAFGSNSTNADTVAANACTNLETVDFSRCVSLASIGDGAFANTVLKQADLSQTALTTIFQNAFRYCAALKTVKLPASLESPGSIGTNAFNGCSALEACVLYGFPPTLANTNAFDGVYAAFKIYAPSHLIPLYLLTTWSSFKDRIIPLNEYVELNEYIESESF
ncbi:MAG: leucine-rich repeat domain-containing protein [Spirochaetaceae bacterium]|jgi:hypothetical protein|nr:leucine-rich repeat domain-containing protein [Spirochaetaceae bacterium]